MTGRRGTQMSKDWGNLKLEGEIEKWDDPCNDFIEWKIDPPLDDESGIGKSREKQLRTAITGKDANGNEYNTEWDAWDQFHPNWQARGNPETDGQLTANDGIDYYNHLREHLSKSSVYGNILPIIQDFLDECKKRNIVDANPAAFVLDQTNKPDTTKKYPEITVAQWGQFFRWLGDPQIRAVCVLMAKLALRRGETLNIDLPFLHLDHPIYRDYLNKRSIELRDEVKNNPDSVYIPSDPRQGEEFRGEVRECGNKTAKGKLLPIDRELKRVLIDWISMRGDFGYPYPLFISEKGKTRLRKPLRSLKQELREYGLAVDYIEDNDKNMDNHYFRHFFSTNMQDGEGTYDGANWPWSRIKIIRGDITNSGSGDQNKSGGDNLQRVYTHNWGNLIREPYLRDIYNFGLYNPEHELSG